MNNATSATIIKKLCKDKSITMSVLLTDCNIRKSLIYDMEKRDKTPSAEVFEQIADYLDCSVDYLLGRTDNPEVNR
ncbi:helix-turn-helix domain-containing protein [Anaeromassilibacillus senegalensis]|uniref:helix-turn-helix domain-containing protein n=1 Tax=Anaeromassilibacillus senegalensis TaxID=1673717 RepID=UPI00093B6DFB|nr:helix-turn-helix transcriptional regulator [Anaeromassilibacillus senegalensis]